jgi:hypothetical protein
MSGGRVWGEKCAAVLFSRKAISMQVQESRMKTRGLWGEICARVFRQRATEQWACARRESMESVILERIKLNQWVTHRSAPHECEAGYE